MAVSEQHYRNNPADSWTVGGVALPLWRRFWMILGLVLALVIPTFVEDFAVFQMTQVLVYAMAIVGLNLLTGFNGQFSLGHSAFYAIGAYTAAIMMDRWDAPYYTTLPVAGVVCLVVGFLFGLPALRLEGLYLALATFALAVATPQLLKYKHFEDFTGGVQGISVFKPEVPGWIAGLLESFGATPMSEDQYLYYFTLFVTVILLICAWQLVRSRTGRAMIAIRDNPIAATTMGINTSIYKSLTFGVSALYTGVAGAIGAIVIQYVAPDSFTFLLAVTLFVGMVVGGAASIFGAIFGGIFVLYIPNIADDLSDGSGISWTIYGLFLILAVYLVPAGASGLVRMATARLVKRS